MTDLTDDTMPVAASCLHCGIQTGPGQTTCPACGCRLNDAGPPPRPNTTTLQRLPSITPAQQRGPTHFPPNAGIILQFLPSGACVALPLVRPVLLGRGSLPDLEETLDLSRFNAEQHGVSRHHCLLQRSDLHMVVIDQDSTNGTFLNGQRLLPRQPYVVGDGDRLILGTLHVIVVFQAL